MKYPLTVLLGFVLSLAPGSVSAQAPSAHAMAALNEPPLTQGDIDAYIAIAPRLIRVIVGAPHQVLFEIQDIYEKAGWNERRFFFILGKMEYFRPVNLSMPVDELVSVYAQLSSDDPMIPTREEILLAKENLLALREAVHEIQARWGPPEDLHGDL